MFRRKIIMTTYDSMRVSSLVMAYRDPDSNIRNYLCEELAKLLGQAKIVPSHKISEDVITMNSKVRLKDHTTREEKVLTLVFPREEDIENLKVSVMSPIGTSMLGRKVGDSIAGLVNVEEIVYQPESAGHFHL